MKSNRSRVGRADSDSHSLIRRDGYPATVAVLPDTEPVTELGRAVAW